MITRADMGCGCGSKQKPKEGQQKIATDKSKETNREVRKERVNRLVSIPGKKIK